jgi:hypothetical protein
VTDNQFPIDGTQAVPEPLTPHDCELQDFKFMPLDVARLRSSEQNSDVTPEANWAALMLWAASWHEVPAGSIPDNDGWIAKACGYVSRGTVDPQWTQVKPGALRKFVLCTDGRLYHPVVAEKALEAWSAKLEQRWRTECGRIKKHNDRHELKGAQAVPKPTYDEWIAAGRPTGQPLPVPSDKPATFAKRPKGQGQSVPRETHSKGQGEGQGQGLMENPSGSEAAAPRATRKPPAGFEVTAAMVEWAADKASLLDRNMLRRETDKFRDHTFKFAISDWIGAWRNWMRRAHDDLAKHAPRSGASVETPYQRSKRETVEAATGGLASRKTLATEVSHGQPTAPAIAG